MFSLSTKFLLVAAFLVLGGVSAVMAQVPGGEIKITVTESFAVRGTLLPAGEYSISRLANLPNSPSVLLLRGQGKSVIFDTTPTLSETAAKNTAVTFEKIDGQLFLSKIWFSGETVGKEVVVTKADLKQIARLRNKKPSATTDTGL